jgi:glycosyltransferase involved in cell wall biosynthesis
MARLCDHLIVVAERDRDEGLARGVGTPSQYRVIRSGIRTADFTRAKEDSALVRQGLGVAPDAPLVGSVMRLAPPKDPNTFLRAAAFVLSRRPDSRFVVVGDGPQRQQAEALAAELGLGDRMIFTGLRRDVAAILGALDVFVLSSNSEGLPRVIPEAMAAGVAVVASDVGGVSEVVREGITGRLVPPGDAAAMADSVIGLLDDPAGTGLLVRGGQELVGEFDVEVMQHAIRELYHLASSVELETAAPIDGGDRVPR